MGFSEEDEDHVMWCPVRSGFILCKCPTDEDLKAEAAEARWDAEKEG